MGLFSAVPALAAGPFDHCGSSDAKCVGEVLLAAMKTANLPTLESVNFYEGNNCVGDLAAAINFTRDHEENLRRCSILKENGHYAYSYQRAGKCYMTSAQPFRNCESISSDITN